MVGSLVLSRGLGLFFLNSRHCGGVEVSQVLGEFFEADPKFMAGSFNLVGEGDPPFAETGIHHAAPIRCALRFKYQAGTPICCSVLP